MTFKEPWNRNEWPFIRGTGDWFSLMDERFSCANTSRRFFKRNVANQYLYKNEDTVAVFQTLMTGASMISSYHKNEEEYWPNE